VSLLILPVDFRLRHFVFRRRSGSLLVDLLRALKKSEKFWEKQIPEKPIPTFGLKMKGKSDCTLHFDREKQRYFGITFFQKLHFK